MRQVFSRTIRLLLGSALAGGAILGLVLAWRGPAGDVGFAGSLRGLWRAANVPWLILLVVLAALEWRLVMVLARTRVGERRAPQGGSAVFEFAMLFPIAVMVLMIMVQLSLLMQGNLVINYGAYAAVRSATVQIPRDLVGLGEPRNVLLDDRYGAKMERIRRAAVLALTPISGRLPPAAEALDIQANLRLLYDQAGERPRAGLGQAFAQKFTYADERTRIIEVGPPQGTDDAFTPWQAVRVVIQHDLVLSVPFARAIFADGSFEDADGTTHYYTTVEAHYQLTNEGPRAVPLEPYCPEPPWTPSPWQPPDTGCPYH